MAEKSVTVLSGNIEHYFIGWQDRVRAAGAGCSNAPPRRFWFLFASTLKRLGNPPKRPYRISSPLNSPILRFGQVLASLVKLSLINQAQNPLWCFLAQISVFSQAAWLPANTAMRRLYLHRAILTAIDAARTPADIGLPATTGGDDGQ